jgi:hypothetical protein
MLRQQSREEAPVQLRDRTAHSRLCVPQQSSKAHLPTAASPTSTLLRHGAANDSPAPPSALPAGSQMLARVTADSGGGGPATMLGLP